MKQPDIQTTRLENGLTLLVETLPDVQSAACSLWIPAGSAYEPEGCNGAAAALCDWMFRGAGQWSSRELSSALDSLGVQAHESVTASHLILQGACLAGNLPEAIAVYGDIVRRPRLLDEEYEPTMLGLEQSLQAMEDDPRQKVMVELARRCYPRPWHRPPEGTLDELEAITPEVIRKHFKACVSPHETIVGVAGNIDFNGVLATVQRVFGDWQPSGPPLKIETQRVPSNCTHLAHDATQTQIGVAYRATPYRDPDYFAAWAAVSVLSGGPSSRLFTEVREKRALCYSVYASLQSLHDDGMVLCYAGSTNERAQETLDVLLSELQRLKEGIGEDELARCKARAKSSLIMSQESTSARAASLARDWYHLGRVMTLDEIRGRIDALTPQDVLDYVHRRPAEDFSILTLGPEELSCPNHP